MVRVFQAGGATGLQSLARVRAFVAASAVMFMLEAAIAVLTANNVAVTRGIAAEGAGQQELSACFV